MQLPVAAALDPFAVAAVAILAGLGLANLAALGDTSVMQHQLVVDAAGVALFVMLRRSRTDGLRWLGWGCYVLSVLLLVAVDLGGTTVNGARRWLAFGSFTMQPSELAKLGLLLVLAQVLGSDRSWPRRLAAALAVAALPIALVVTQPDLSTAAVLCAVTATMLVLGRIPLKVLVLFLVTAVLVLPLGEHLLHPYQQERLDAFLSGSTDANGPGWAILQMHIALAWGGLTGGATHPLHNLVALYLPEGETDLAFASLVEQRGILAGALAVLAAAVLVWRVVSASRRARSRSAALAAAGFAVLLSVEVAVSVAGNLGLVPTAGVPFPLLSYGGTAATVHIAALGLVLALRADGETHRLWSRTGPDAVRPRLLRTTAVAVTGTLLAMVGFVWQLQSADGTQLRAAALSQMMRCTRVPAARGDITDRHGVPFAVDARRDRVATVPALVRPDEVPTLAALTAQPERSLRRLLRRHQSSLDLTVASLPPAAGRRVRAAGLPGVFVVPDTRRLYRAGALGPLLGWTGVATPVEMERWPDLPLGALVGRTGLEQTYDPILRGTDGRQCVYVTPAGTPVSLGPYIAPRRGSTVRLTLDLGLQRKLTEELATALRGYPGQPRGDLGGTVVLDPRNGQVLAMASLPSYHSSVFGPPVRNRELLRLAHQPGSPMLEHATQVAAPPGSTFKLVVAAANLREGLIPPDRVLPGGGGWTLGDHTFGNWMALPAQSLPEALSWSNDVYFYQLAWALGPRPIIRTARSLGVGHQTGIDLPAESSGYLGTPASVTQAGGTWYAGSTVILGIGQGYLTATPLQDALWTAGVATGSMVTPHLGLGYGHGLRRYTPLRWPRPHRLPYADRLGPVRAGMALAATTGTASILTALPVTSGAKTGSAEDPSSTNGAPDSWFTAAAPFKRPRMVATSFVRGGGHGVSTSGAVVLPVMQYFFAHEREIMHAGPTAKKRR
ncbi:FtsW/RodA/SpoVE family cell cycle protein [Nocardioides mesophilus]|uniref:FtsW/RodA/SpoVE family cell cycle protein n=1 Tax=Nocardioides mesophilus TaxID=433659 RepID=UPI001CB6CC29|nr:FtsW/RodA/SpoVE family cell cycle protein [Nocardioides mesophilus]